MGGNAFAAEGLRTPRMSPAIYEQVLQQVIRQLRTVYGQVEAPLEAPAKLDYGDIDVLVVPHAEQPNAREIAKLLGAVRFKGTANTTTHYALPWPDELPTGADDTDAVPQNLQNIVLGSQVRGSYEGLALRAQQKYIQVDVNHNKDAEELTFTKFLHAHGDFWSIVGSMIRPFGLTCSDGGLYIRITELEHWDRKRARVKIIGPPDEILDYLGIEAERFWKPFDTIEACMDLAATCRFHDPSRGQSWDETRGHAESKEDRKKHSQRTMFAHWLDEYLPSHRGAAVGGSSGMTRDEVVDEAKTKFGADFTERYERQKAQGLAELGESKLWTDLRDQIPAEGSKLTYALKGLKAQVGATPDRSEDEEGATFRDVRAAFRGGRFEAVKEWALAHWEEAAVWQEDWNREQSHRHLMQKLERDRVKAGDATLQTDTTLAKV